MRKKTIFSLFFISLLLFFSCLSKRYAKKGAEFEAVGYYEKAAEMYYLAVSKNDKNVEAQIGLKKTGQLSLDKQLKHFMDLYKADNTKDAVYQFIEADNFYNKLKNIGTNLDFSNSYREYYDEIKNSYLKNKYKEGLLFLEEENFAEAEKIFTEVLSINPNYYDTKTLKKTAHYEPIYRQAKEKYNTQKFRKAYFLFQTVCKGIPNYKDSEELLKNSLEKALVTIAVVDFKNNTNVKNELTRSLKNHIKKSILNIRSPFIKLIDSENNQLIKAQQLLYLQGKTDKQTSAKAGKMLGVKYLLTGVVERVRIDHLPLSKSEQKGYVEEKEVVKDEETETESINYYYYKVNYFEYTQEKSVYIKFNYSLISAETGEVVLSDVLALSNYDRIRFAVFKGDKRKLLPGYWKYKNVDSVEDEIYNSQSAYNQLQTLLNARREIKSVEQLVNEVNSKLASSVAKKIQYYDPEK